MCLTQPKAQQSDLTNKKVIYKKKKNKQKQNIKKTKELFDDLYSCVTSTVFFELACYEKYSWLVVLLLSIIHLTRSNVRPLFAILSVTNFLPSHTHMHTHTAHSLNYTHAHYNVRHPLALGPIWPDSGWHWFICKLGQPQP